MRIAIMGAGSLGTIIGALMTEAGEQVELIDVNEEHIYALNESGARITGFISKTIPVTALKPEQMKDEYDVVFLLTKQVYNAVSLEQLLPHLHKDSVVCTLQNGVPEEYVASVVGSERTVGGVVGFGATWMGPGQSELTTEWETVTKYAFDIGEIDGTLTDRLQKIKAVLEHIGYCEVTTNIMGMKWSKVLMNATFSGMSAALGCTFGQVMDDSVAMTCLAQIADETIKVARAHGIQLSLMQGKNMELLELKEGESVQDKWSFYEEVWSPHRNLKASMLQDLEKKRKTEIDYINGFVSQKGKEVGVLTLFNDVVVRLVKEAEESQEIPDFATNLHYLQEHVQIGQNI